MRLLWVLAALLIAAAGVALIVSDTRIPMVLVIAGSAMSLIDQYRTRNRQLSGAIAP